MTLVAMIIALLANRLLSRFEHHREPRWFLAWVRLLQKIRIPNNGFLVLLAVMTPVLMVILVSLWLPEQHWSNGLWLAFSVVVLWLSLGPKDVFSQVSDYLQVLKYHDTQQSKQRAADILEIPIAELPTSPIQHVQRYVLTAANDRYFAVLFWFVVLHLLGAGPAGALMYRGAEYLAAHPNIGMSATQAAPIRRAASRLHNYLAWIPAHLLALVYPLFGNFYTGLRGWQHYLEQPSKKPQSEEPSTQASKRVLIGVGLASLQIPTDDFTEVENADQPVIHQLENADRIGRYSLFFALGVFAVVIAAGQWW